MIWVSDKTGRFPKRPHYEARELDDECENRIESLLRQRKGSVKYPVATDDLLFALEQDATVDHYADLPSDASGEVWGVSRFRRDGKPEVRINRLLSENPRFENPYRTTITHESAHVWFHGFLFAMLEQSGSLFDEEDGRTQSCNRQQLDSWVPYDWIEWQASYCSGALLMPTGAACRLATKFFRSRSLSVPKVPADSRDGEALVEEMTAEFQVSPLAARVRLSKLGFLTESKDAQPDLLT